MRNIAIFANLALIGFAIFLYFDIDTVDTKDIKVIATFILVPLISLFVIMESSIAQKKKKSDAGDIE
ncbi:MAG TPA: hypothetical protein VIN02_09310 [Sulfurovum sp.]